jgi:enoyl-CoA hydratase
MDFENLLWEIEQNILIITLNRPDKLNALSQGLMTDLQQAFLQAKQENIKGIILTGSGEKAFVAGADIAEFQGLDELNKLKLWLQEDKIFSLK